MSVENLIQSTGEAAGANDTIKQGIGLYQQVQQVQQQQQQIQQQKEELTQAQTNGLGNRLLAASFTPNAKQQKFLLDSAEQYASQAQIPFDRQGFEATLNDPGSKLQIQSGIKDVLAGKVAPDQFLGLVSNGPGLINWAMNKSGEAAKYAQQTQLEAMKEASSERKSDSKNQTTVVVQGMKGDSAQGIADTRAQGLVDAAKARGGQGSAMQERVKNQINGQYQSTMKGYEGALAAADQLARTVNDVDLGKLNASKNVRSELENKIATLINQGKAATVSGVEGVKQASYYQDLQDHLNKIFGSNNNTLTQANWDQLKKEINSFRDSNSKLHADAYESFREGVSPDYRTGVDARYNKYRQGKGLDRIVGADGQVQADESSGGSRMSDIGTPMGKAGSVPGATGSAPPKLNDAQLQAYVKAAKAAGYTEAAAIAHYNQVHGIK